eukprot:8080610-Pyramimonas_sp.AAC.1
MVILLVVPIVALMSEPPESQCLGRALPARVSSAAFRSVLPRSSSVPARVSSAAFQGEFQPRLPGSISQISSRSFQVRAASSAAAFQP